MENLYYIDNVGCDDETVGLVRISDEDFPKFKKFIENLNKNSKYGCMPKIYVYKIDMNLLREKNDDDERYAYLYLDDKIYVLRDRSWLYDQEPIIL